MPRYLNPKNDLVFKKIFGSHPNLLKSFLNAFLPLPSGHYIESLEYLPTGNVPIIPEFKYSIVDVRCVDQQGRHFIVEMQLQWIEGFMSRMLFNTSSAYVRQLKKGEGYEKLCPVYGLAIVDALFSKEKEWFHHYRMTRTTEPYQALEDIQLVFLELPKFQPNTFAEKIARLWLRYLTEINEETVMVDQTLLEDPDIREALEYTQESAYSIEELRGYDASWDAVSSGKTMMQGRYAEGKAEGRAEGKAEIVKNMLQAQLDDETILKLTGLSATELKRFK